jgi:hypothetical protein
MRTPIVRRFWALALAGAVLSTSPPAQAQSTAADDGGFLDRFLRHYLDDLNPPPAATPADDAPLPRRPAPFPPQPQTTPPMPFTDWPYGGSATIGANLPNQVPGALGTALAPTGLGRALNEAGIQVYGWLNSGFNLSNNTRATKGGNAPVAYTYNANTVSFDQGALYIERVPNTVQREYIDWGFRVTGIYGTNYRYTTAYGLFSGQLLGHNNQNGYDIPMAYGELYIPWVAGGMVIRAGRFISLPDIEAQLAVNNYMYTHSMTYTFDNYTNTGLMTTTQLNRNWILQLGVTTGTDTLVFNRARDPGSQPSGTGCLRWTSDDSSNSVYGCANGLNNGRWGYNNLQQYVLTLYHSFNPRWHISWENLYMYQRNAPNLAQTGGSYENTPFASIRRNPPNQAQCQQTEVANCTARAFGSLVYLNYRLNDFNNITLRAEYYDDMQGQRTGTRTRYLNAAIGLQHFITPSVILRPEIGTYNALDRRAFDGQTRRSAIIAAADLVFRF